MNKYDKKWTDTDNTPATQVYQIIQRLARLGKRYPNSAKIIAALTHMQIDMQVAEDHILLQIEKDAENEQR